VHRWSILITVQRDATQSSLFIIMQFTLHVSGVNHTHHQEYIKLYLQPPVLVIFFVQLPPSKMATLATLEGGSCTVPESVVTVLCTPDDGCGWHPKHVDWTYRIINRLLCVASRWTVINIEVYKFRTGFLSNIRSLVLYSSVLIPLASSQHNLYDIYLLLCVRC